MTDSDSPRQNRQSKQPPRVRAPRFTEEEKCNFGMMRAFKEEIENVKDTIRAAVVLEVKQAEGEALTDEELKTVNAKQTNILLLEKLEGVHDRFSKRFRINQTYQFLSDSDIWYLLKFLYVVRLSQQGFLHIVCSQFPYIEPRAITYLADQLISHSLYARQSVHIRTRVEHKDQVRAMVKKFRDRLEEPVGDGFTTTYKQVMNVVEELVDMAFNEEEDRRKKEERDNAIAENEGNSRSATAASTSSTQIPPSVWVLMPYSNMTDGNTVALPGMKPSNLPFPSELLQQMPHRNLPQIYPFMAMSLPPQLPQQPAPDDNSIPNITQHDQQSPEQQIEHLPPPNQGEFLTDKISGSVSVVSNGTSSEKPHTAEQQQQQKPSSSSASLTAPVSRSETNTSPSSVTGSTTITHDNNAFEYSRPEEFEDIDADNQYADRFADPEDEDQFADPDEDTQKPSTKIVDNNNDSSNCEPPEPKNSPTPTHSYIEGNRNRAVGNDNDGLSRWKNFAADHQS